MRESRTNCRARTCTLKNGKSNHTSMYVHDCWNDCTPRVSCTRPIRVHLDARGFNHTQAVYQYLKASTCVYDTHYTRRNKYHRRHHGIISCRASRKRPTPSLCGSHIWRSWIQTGSLAWVVYRTDAVPACEQPVAAGTSHRCRAEAADQPGESSR